MGFAEPVLGLVEGKTRGLDPTYLWAHNPTAADVHVLPFGLLSLQTRETSSSSSLHVMVPLLSRTMRTSRTTRK